MWSPFFSRGESPGAQHATIDEAREAAEADGTRSILDLDHISDEPEFCAASPVPEEELIRYFGTTKPTREMAEENDSMILEEVDRGHGVYYLIYRDGKPDEIYFGGYSFD